MVLRDHYP